MKSVLFSCIIFLAHTTLLAQTSFCKRITDSLLTTLPRQISADEKKQIVQCIYEIQNEGFAFDEEQCKYDSAKIKIESALKIWNHLNDTLSKANLLKYLGYLNGRIGRFSSGKKQIAEAIVLYNSKKAEYGVAVSWFDLSRIYEFENKPDSAIFFLYKALDYWKRNNNSSRIMNLNSNLINLLMQKNRKQDIIAIIKENHDYLKMGDIYWLQELDFYYVASKYFKRIKDNKNENKYSELYTAKIASLDKINIKNKYSLFDERNCR